MKQNIYLSCLLFQLVAITSVGCYKDNEEDLYPEILLCDSVDISFTQDIVPLLEQNCLVCHSNASSGVAGAGISLEGYDNIKSYIDNNEERFLGAINHESSYSAMPKGGAKLAPCELAKFKNWVNEGKNNN